MTTCAALALCALAAAALSAQAVITQNGNLRVAVTGKIAPHTLPRSGVSPVSVSVAGKVSTADGTEPPQLKLLTIELNRNGRLDYAGLPLCSLGQIQPASNGRAEAACGSSLVGRGRFSAYLALPGGEPYPAQGKLLVFNGRQGGRQVLFGHIYSANPFATSFVIVFQISTHRHGSYGTTLTADLTKALGAQRNLTGIEMTLSRRFHYKGASHSYISAGCPAPKGVGTAGFPLARTSFSFAGGAELTSTLNNSCKVRG